MDQEEAVARALCATDEEDPDQHVEVVYRLPGDGRVVGRQPQRRWQTRRGDARRFLAALHAAETTPRDVT